MPGFMPGIHVFTASKRRRGWPGQARPWRVRCTRSIVSHPRACRWSREEGTASPPNRDARDKRGDDGEMSPFRALELHQVLARLQTPDFEDFEQWINVTRNCWTSNCGVSVLHLRETRAS